MGLMGYRSRMLLSRAVNIIRPKPRMIPFTVDDLLASSASKDVIDRFSDLLYSSGVMGTLYWRGVPVVKNPLDLWTTIELVQELRPIAVIETGTHYGGSALFYADMAKVLGVATRVITVDQNPKWNIDPTGAGIVSIVGISTTPKVVVAVNEALAEVRNELGDGNVMVFLDSDHSEENVHQELQLYAPMVSVGSYLVVEDTNINGHPSAPDYGPGPWDAVQAFLAEDGRFEVDRERERFLVSFNPGGWLKRVR